MKNKIHSLIVEGIVFCGSGLVLLSYSLHPTQRDLTRAGRSPRYLFPLIVALAMIGLSLWIVGEGVTAMKKKKPRFRMTRRCQKQKNRKAALGRDRADPLCALLCSTCFYKSSVCDHRNFIFAYTFSTFEVVTIVFLITMMIFMGVRKIPVLVFVPIGTTLFLSLAFRTFLRASAIERRKGKCYRCYPWSIRGLSLMVLLGSVAGLFVGAIPGLSVSMATALLVSITYTWEHSDALAMIMGVYVVGVFSGAVSAILINIRALRPPL